MLLGSRLNDKAKSKAGHEVAFLPLPPVSEAADSVKGVTLPFFFIGLAARLATCDGLVNHRETEAFLDVFSRDTYRSEEIQLLFIAACNDNMDDVYYARKIVKFFPDETMLYRQMFLNLLHVAVADAPLATQEITLLKKITAIFHLTDEEIAVTFKQYLVPIHTSRQLIGSRKIMPLQILKQAYHRFLS